MTSHALGNGTVIHLLEEAVCRHAVWVPFSKLAQRRLLVGLTASAAMLLSAAASEGGGGGGEKQRA